MSRKFNVGDTARMKRVGEHHAHRAGDIGDITHIHSDDICRFKVGQLEQWVYNEDLELVIPYDSYPNYLLSRIYEESIANGIAKVDGKVMPIIPGALIEELENYLTKEEDK